MPLGRVIGHVGLTVVVLVALHTLVGLLAALVSRPTGSVTTLVVVQALLGLLAVTLAVRWRTVDGLRAGVPALPWALGGGLLGYAALPAAWQASALVGRQLVGPGPVAWLVDLLLWGACVAVGVLWGDADEPPPEPATTPYG